MKLILSIFIIGVLAFIAGLYLPWWSIAVVAFLVTLGVPQKPFWSFLSGFLGVFILWVLLASFINAANGGILASRIGGLLGIGNHAALLIGITGLVGGLVAGFAALTASYLRKG